MTKKFYSIFGNLPEDNNHLAPTNVDADEETVVASENRNNNERETREICIKWVFPVQGDKKKILHGHHTILAMMLKEHPDIIIIDNKGREHTDKKTMISTEKSRPFEFYNENNNRNKRMLACIHRMRTKQSLSELKESWGVLDKLKEHQAYVRNHAFGEKDREISHIGFIPGVNMTNTNKNVVKDEIEKMLRSDNQEVPKFEIVQVRVDMGKGSKTSERTRAYEIQCMQKDAPRLAKLLQSGQFRQQPVYIPYRFKKSKPEIFKNAIKRQIKVLADQWVIKVHGFTPDMIQQIKQVLTDEFQIEAAVPTYNKARGEWKLLVNRHDHQEAMKRLQSNWSEIVKTIPTSIQEASPFDMPKIISRNPSTHETSSEEGTVDTYGTILSSLYYGNKDEDGSKSDGSTDSATTPNDTPTNRPVIYAQVLRGANSSASQVSGWTEQRQDELVQLQEKHSDLEEKFNTVTAELVELKQMMQLLLTQSLQQQNNTEPPSKKQATFDTPKRSEKRMTRQDTNMEIEHEPAKEGSETGQDQLPRNEY